MSNYSFAIWIALSAGLLVLFLYAAYLNFRKQHSPEIGLDEVIPSLQPVNLAALSQIIAPPARGTSLSAAESNERKRQVRQAIDYLRRMSHNAGQLQRIGYGRLHSPNQLVASQAQELIDAGVHVRLYTLMGLARLHLWRFSHLQTRSMFALGQIGDLQQLMSSNIIPAYEALRMKAENLTRLRDSGYRDALMQAL